LAQNLKDIGGGKVWIVGTAQQTLTEDDPRATLNSPELYKLKDRFPITVELESSDIREICYRRLLGKSAAGATELGAIFDRHGPALRHNTKLTDAKYYDSAFDRGTFVNLYPFLPAHFDILLHLLSALAKSTGGIGLRSAIKVIQDTLVEGAAGQPPAADRDVGWLATTVTLYDTLDRDIHRAFPSVHKAVEKVLIRFPGDPLKRDVAKTVAVLQILGNLPVTVPNVAGLMHPAVNAASEAEAVKAAVDELLNDSIVPLGEKDGSLRFFSEKLNDVEQERAQLALRSADVRRVVNEALTDLFDQPPSAQVHGTLSVSTGLKHQLGAHRASLAGERETIQTVLVFADSADYETERSRLVSETLQRSAESTIYLLGRQQADAQDLAAEIVRSNRIVELHRNDPDQEVREYCASQTERAVRLRGDLSRVLGRSLAQGSFVFRGSATAVDSLDSTFLAACRKQLAHAAERVFDRYPEAPKRVETALAEKFLRAPNLRSATSQIDPLGLVQITGGSARIDTNQKALVSIRDYVDRNGTVDGKRLLDVFSDSPFGWSPDTVRYLVSALLLAGEVKLRVSGREVTVNGQQAIEALKTNNTFKAVGVSLRNDRPSNEVLARAAERLTELGGDNVLPLEEEISKAAQRALTDLQHRLSSLPEKLASRGLLGADTLEDVARQIRDLMLSDGSEAPQRFGAEQSPLFDSLRWAIDAQVAFDQGVGDTVKAIRIHQEAIAGLPRTGAPGELGQAIQEELDALSDLLSTKEFFRQRADLNTRLTAVRARVAETVRAMEAGQTDTLKAAAKDLALLPEWRELTAAEQESTLAQLQALAVNVHDDVDGLKRLVAGQFDIAATLADMRRRIAEEGRKRRLEREHEEATVRKGGEGEVRAKVRRPVEIPAYITSEAELDALIGLLEDLRHGLRAEEFDLVVSAD
jgi:hypothetical protein